MFLEHAPLQSRHTFAIDVSSRFLQVVASEAELIAALQTVTARNQRLMVLGGGSNVVFSRDYDGLVLCPALLGIHARYLDDKTVLVEAAAGENWHGFVQYCLAQGWYGLENLSLIPGTVGAAPVQNIGAYGVELKDCLHSVRAICRQTGQPREFTLAECHFGYRDSIFKQQFKDAYVISAVRLVLSLQVQVKLQYGDIARRLQQAGIDQPQPRDVAAAIIAIRRSKLPDPADIGNCGSFFKNPVISVRHYQVLLAQYPEMIAYPQPEGVKLAAGWLIEQAGWKGRSLGRAGVYEKQALVLVNRGGATGPEVTALAQAIQHDVALKFGVALEIEVNIV